MKIHHDEMMELTGKKYDYCVYIDGTFRITCDIKPLVYSLIEDGRSIAIHEHCSRDCIYEEAESCMWLSKADAKGVNEQVKFYRKEGMPEHFGLHETGVIIRKCNDSKLNDIMHQWWLQIERFTHRDQLGLSYVLWKNGMKSSYIYIHLVIRSGRILTSCTTDTSRNNAKV